MTRLHETLNLHCASQATDAVRVCVLAAYKDFLPLWKNADRDIPIYKQAKGGVREVKVAIRI